MKELLLEIEILYKKMNETNLEYEQSQGNQDIPFAKVLYALTRSVDKEYLFNMSNSELLSHIHKIQTQESY